MKKLRLYLPLILFAVILWSCREVYYPDDIESNENIPVIQGTIMEGANAEISIYWAISYETSEIRYVTDAVVTVSDDVGNVAECVPTAPGTYVSFGMSGVPGRAYTLRVVLSDGREYISNPQFLHSRPQLDSLYAVPGKSSTYTYGASGIPYVKILQGLFIKSDFSTNFPSTLYYRFNTTVVTLSSYTVEMQTPSSYSIFVWETTTMDESYSVDYSAPSNNFQVLYKHPAGFLRYYYDATLETSDQTAPFIEAWVVKQNIYSISGDAYQYYSSVGNLLGGNNRIFAPVASQVKSNIFCSSDAKEKVIGIFQASSVTTIYKAFGWTDLKTYKSRELDYFPDVGSGSVPRFPPSFWIYF